MSHDEPAPIDEAEVTRMLEHRTGRAALSDRDRERLVRSIMAQVDARSAAPVRSRLGWRALAASMAGLAVVLVAGSGLILGMPASVPASVAPSAPPATSIPFDHPPLRVLDASLIPIWTAAPHAGTALVRATIDRTTVPAPVDCPTTVCPLPLGVIHAASPGRDLVVVTAPDIATAADQLPPGPFTGAYRAGTDGTLELLGVVDQGQDMVEPLVAAAGNLVQAMATRAKDTSALVVTGWLIGPGPLSSDGRKRLVADPADHDRDQATDPVVLPDDAYATWTAWSARDGGMPDDGFFVVRRNPDAPGEWRIVGRLDDGPGQDAVQVLRINGWAVLCGSIPSGDCGTVAAVFARAKNFGLPGGWPATPAVGALQIEPRDTCPTQVPATTSCWRVMGEDAGAAGCTVIGIDVAPGGRHYAWDAEPVASAPTGGRGTTVTCE